MGYVYDTESNGFLNEATKLHCLALVNPETFEALRFNNQRGTKRDGTIEDGLRLLQDADFSVAHNLINHDAPLCRKLNPWFNPTGKQIDTLIMSRLLYTDLRDKDFQYLRRNDAFPKRLIGSHSLEAWGHRIGEYKDDYDGGWDEWNQDMDDYCLQDTIVGAKLYNKFAAMPCAEEAMELEHQVAWIVARQMQRGFRFDERAAFELVALLEKRHQELVTTIRSGIPDWLAPNGKLSQYKRDSRRWVENPHGAKLRVVKGREERGWWEYLTGGVDVQSVKPVEFNPSSRPHIARVLSVHYGWKPKEFTDDGRPKVDETVLSRLRIPIAEPLIEYLTVEKRLGQIAHGDKAWLKHVTDDGRIHGYVNTNGAVTGRMTHSYPNMAQTPAGYSPYGAECRALFVPSRGMKLVGCDADGLELRDLAGYMARYDNGAYVKTVLEGKKEDGTDNHSVNMRALGIDNRDVAKTWFYAFIYGAGDYKLGEILIEALPKEKRPRTKKGILQLGAASRARFAKNLPALGKLVDKVKATAKARGHLRGLDGRRLNVRSEHAALNTLLQSAGAVQMKKALVILDNDLQEAGLVPGVDYEFVANVHDEWQMEAKPEHAELVGRTAADAIRKAGEYYNFRCPLAGSYDIGDSWRDTH